MERISYYGYAFRKAWVHYWRKGWYDSIINGLKKK